MDSSGVLPGADDTMQEFQLSYCDQFPGFGSPNQSRVGADSH